MAHAKRDSEHASAALTAVHQKLAQIDVRMENMASKDDVLELRQDIRTAKGIWKAGTAIVGALTAIGGFVAGVFKP